ncbi:DUF1697 domain-containing protein [Maribacter sp. X9]|uniref:DUF1697 domain-containing protein n=1 Tax=Maribacter sp. X9 TaxID=3402159 RepID=UPI003AF3EE23
MELRTYVAFLRGINVSGQKKVPMQVLRTLCGTLGLQEVKTYIQSGNIVFKSPPEETYQLEERLTHAIQTEFGFEVPVIVKTVERIIEIWKLNPFKDPTELSDNKIYFVLLKTIPEDELVKKLINESFVNEDFQVVGDCIYLKCNIGYGKAKLNNNLIERKLNVMASTRNYRTMNKMLEMAR